MHQTWDLCFCCSSASNSLSHVTLVQVIDLEEKEKCSVLSSVNDDCTKLLMNVCIVFVCEFEFIERDSCLVGLRRYPEQ